MASSKQVLLLVTVAAIACLASLASAKQWMVGEELGWRARFNVTGWAHGKTFVVGDSLLFRYPKENHAVAQVGKDDFAACNLQGDQLGIWASGNDVVTLDKPGKVWFICTKPNHCANGMKLAIDVVVGATTAPAPGPAVTPSVEKRRTRIKSSTILSIALGIVLSAFVASLIFICVWRRRKQDKLLPYLSNTEIKQSVNLSLLDLPTLKIATENFAERNKLGQGGFGVVYKGALPDGEQIAVKRLSEGSSQGIGELKNELVLIAKLHHKNIVRLVGVCLEEQENLVVYEYMPNRSLDTVLFDPEKSKDLDWGKRFRIISGIARGLQYVHEDSQLKIIHRDLKASNILLDLDLNPKISDFGLARLFEQDQTKDVTNRIAGTFGYMAPEYVMCGQYSTKSDVFSFGVLLLEIITGRRGCGFYNFKQSVDSLAVIWEKWFNGRTLEIVDPLLSSFSEDQVRTCVHVGLLCIQESQIDRPAMSAVNVILSTGTSALPIPSKPAFCIQNISNNSMPHQGVSRATREPAVQSKTEASTTELDLR